MSSINDLLAGKRTGGGKTILYIIGIVLLLGAIVVGAMFLIPKDTTEAPPATDTIVNEDEVKQKEIMSLITQNISLGETKANVIAKFGAKEEHIGKNYVVNPNYIRIGKHDFLSAFIFKDDLLVAIVHERVLDGTQKHNLAVEFQKFISEIGETYKLVDTKETWFSTELIYDADTWNDAIIGNDLELMADFENEENKEFVKVIASGMNYFDFLVKDRENLSVGNLNLIYTSSVYKDNFMGFVSLAAEE